MKKLAIFISLSAIVFAGCKQDDEFSGPDLNNLYGGFSVIQDLDISNRNVDFSSGESTYFTASFSKSVEWKIEIKGLTSGAIKNIEGFSNDLNNVNALWNGTTTILPMFKGEECAVEVTFANQPDTLRDTLTVVAGRLNQGFLLSDFENGFPANWITFIQSGANMSFNIQTSDVSAQGSHYYDMGGEVNWDWLKGYVYIPASAYGAQTFPLNSNPANVYFNTFYYKVPTLNNALILFQFCEDDNEDGVFNTSNEDMYSIQVTPTVGGWSQLSVNYADLAALVNGAPATPAGNGVKEPHKLKQVNILHLANPTSGYAQSYIDYLIFTENGPLIP